MSLDTFFPPGWRKEAEAEREAADAARMALYHSRRPAEPCSACGSRRTGNPIANAPCRQTMRKPWNERHVHTLCGPCFWHSVQFECPNKTRPPCTLCGGRLGEWYTYAACAQTRDLPYLEKHPHPLCGSCWHDDIDCPGEPAARDNRPKPAPPPPRPPPAPRTLAESLPDLPKAAPDPP